MQCPHGFRPGSGSEESLATEKGHQTASSWLIWTTWRHQWIGLGDAGGITEKNRPLEQIEEII